MILTVELCALLEERERERETSGYLVKMALMHRSYHLFWTSHSACYFSMLIFTRYIITTCAYA